MTEPSALTIVFLAGVATAMLVSLVIQLASIADAAASIARSLAILASHPPPAMPHAAEAPAAPKHLHAVGEKS